MHYIKGIKNIGVDSFFRMRFETNQINDNSLDELCAVSDEPQCIMHGPVLQKHQDEDSMLQTIKSACLAGRNNPDYHLMPLLGCRLVAY